MIRPSLSLGFRAQRHLTGLNVNKRYQSTQPGCPLRRRQAFIGIGAGLAGIFGLSYLSSPTYLEAPRTPTADDILSADESLSSLIRAYIVYTACAIPALVDSAPKIISTVQSIPVIKQISEGVIRYTFFDHVSPPFSM